MRVLVLSAFAPELEELRRVLKSPDVPARVRAGVTCLPAGIGVVDAAVGATRALERLRPGEVLFIGTAGSYAADPAIGSAVVARRLHLVSAARARGDGYVPPPLIQRAQTDVALRSRVQTAVSSSAKRAAIVDVATPIAITTRPSLARAHADATGAAVENLEAFGVARAATEAGVPFAAVLGVSNRVGPHAHEQWRRHQDAAMRAVVEVVLAYLRARLKGPSR